MHEASPCIRRLTTDDINAVNALARIVWQDTYPSLISQEQIDFMLADRYAPARIREQLSDPNHAWWVAAQDHTLIGFAHAARDKTGCKLEKLYVHPACQRQGIGTALLHSIEVWARALQIHRLWLQVNRGNTQAIRAYSKYGFKIIASRVFDIGNGFTMDDHIMERTL